ncbi:hypothetical protein VE03_08719 [Pseudogymnoascus sp. 23342-1-I1]|nr:hypothetical protein VE03_08719 [Pseudogymnoascus sp. 23342-1-I1]
MPPSPAPTLPALTRATITSEPDLLKYIQHSYALTSLADLGAAGYADFAYRIENWRWEAVGGRGECAPLGRREMDRLWVRCVMEGWMRMAWCWEGDVEGVVIALLEREDGRGVEEMWEERGVDYPELDVSLRYPIVGENGIFEDYGDLGVRAVISPEIRCHLEKAEDGTDDLQSDLVESVADLGLVGLTAAEEEFFESAIAETEDAGSDDEDADDKDADDNDADNKDADDEEPVTIKKEDDGIENNLHGIQEAVSSLDLADSVGKDDGNKEAVTIKEEEDTEIEIEKYIKKENDDEPAHGLPADISAIFQTREIGAAPPSPAQGTGNANPAAYQAAPANTHAAPGSLCGLCNPGSGTDGVATNLSESVAEPAMGEPRATGQGVDGPMDSIPRSEYANAAQNPTPREVLRMRLVTASNPAGTVGHYRAINGVEHFFPEGTYDNGTGRGVCSCSEFGHGYAAAMADRVFQPGPEFYKMSAMSRVTYYLNWKTGSASRAQAFAHNPVYTFQGNQAVGYKPAPMFQLQTDAHKPAVDFQGRILPQFKGQTAFCNPAPVPRPVFRAVRQVQYTFINLNPDNYEAYEMANTRKHDSLAVPRTHQSTPHIKTEEGVEIKTEPGEPERRQSHSVFERKRTRDMDSEDEEDQSLERPRKFSR